MKKIREEKFLGSPDVSASVVSIELNIFLLIFGAFYTISAGGFITRYGDLMSIYSTVLYITVDKQPCCVATISVDE